MGATDALLARLQGEIEERSTFMDNLVEGAEKDGRDLTEQEMSLLARTRDRIGDINKQVDPLREAAKIAGDSRKRTADIARQFEEARNPDAIRSFEYRSAGEYAVDMWRAGLGQSDARERLDLYNRAAAHQTTGDNPGLIPTPILGPVVNFIDAQRPMVNALGPRQLPSGSWSRPLVTQHTQIAAQAGEKTELASRKMTISKVAVTPNTYGGYVNVSRQDLDWTQPAIMDLVINDLSAQYAIATEAACATALYTAGTAADASTTIPTGAATPAQVAGAIWAGAGKIYAATLGVGQVYFACSPDMLGLIGPLFAPIQPRSAQSEGFYAGAFGQGAMPAISGVQVIVSAGFAPASMLMFSTAAAEVYEDRVGSLQVIEPSVLGVQVAYAGYFTQIVLLATGLQKIVKTP
jgi:HK97 family phage major capsid protein